MIYLETERLILRDYRPEDEEEYCRLKSDPKTMYYLQDLLLETPEAAQADFAQVLADAVSPRRKHTFFRVELKTAGEQIGSIGYSVTGGGPEGKCVHAGYFFTPAFWGRGFATEAFRQVLAYAFEEDNVFRVTTGCLRENKGSERVMQKCGMVQEGEFPDWEYHDGRWKTRVQYRLLRTEYKARQARPLLEKQEILRRLEAVPFLGPECWVTAGAALVLYGVREQTHDIDLICTVPLADRLAAQGVPFRRDPKDGSRIFDYADRIEILENWRTDRVEDLAGVPMASLADIRRQKQALGREKDLADLDRIDAFLAQHPQP